MLYLSILILLILSCYHYDYKNNHTNKFEWYYFLLIIFICIAGFRYRLGSDSTGYEEDYHNFPDLWNLGDYDYSTSRVGRGFIISMAIIKLISPSYFLFQFIHSLFINTVFFYFIKKYCKYIFTALLFYYATNYLYFNFQIIRETFAIAIFLISWSYYLKKSWIKYYSLIIIAIGFHPSAAFLLFLPLLQLRYINNFFKLNYYFLISCVILFFLGFTLSNYIREVLLIIDISDINEYTNRYTQEDGDGIFNRSIKLMLLRLFLYVIIPISIMATYKIGKFNLIKLHSQKMDQYISLLALSVYIGIFSFYIPIFRRFDNYLYPFLWIGLPYILFLIKERLYLKHFNQFFLSYLYAFLIIFINFYSLFISTGGKSSIPSRIQYYPYASIFDQKLNKDREQFYGDIKYRKYNN